MEPITTRAIFYRTKHCWKLRLILRLRSPECAKLKDFQTLEGIAEVYVLSVGGCKLAVATSVQIAIIRSLLR
jgi:hypothetical protein